MFLDIHLVVILKIFKMIAKMISFFFSIDESKLRYLSNMVQVIFYQENIHPISYWKSRKNVNNHCLSEKKKQLTIGSMRKISKTSWHPWLPWRGMRFIIG